MKQEITRMTTPVYRYPLNLQLFAEGDPDPDPQPDPTPEPDKRTVTMTQEELDALISREKARAKKPYADYDDIKAKLEALELAEAERKKAELSEAERLAAELEEARNKAEEAEKAKTSALTAANQRLINAEFKTFARDANIPADRLAAALKLADLSGVTVDNEGNVVGAKQAVEALVADHPYLQAQTKPKSIGGSDPDPGDDDERKTLEAQLAEAKKAKDFSKVIELSNKLLKK